MCFKPRGIPLPENRHDNYIVYTAARYVLSKNIETDESMFLSYFEFCYRCIHSSLQHMINVFLHVIIIYRQSNTLSLAGFCKTNIL